MASSFTLFFLLLIFQLILLPASAGPAWSACSTESNYTAESHFASNLRLLLPSLASVADPSGIFNKTEGFPPDKVFGLALCRGDITSPLDCHNCLNSSIPDFPSRCPNGKSAAIWYDKCMLRYSDKSFFSSVDTSFRVYIFGGSNATDTKRFDELVGGLMDALIARAAYGSARMFATGEVEYLGSERIYGMAQCTRDLSGDECRRCLRDYFGMVPSCCDGRQEVRVFGWSCSVQYALQRFYNVTVDDLNSTNLEFPSSREQGKENNIWTLVLVIVIPIVGVLVLLSAIYACYKRRGTIRRKKNVQDVLIQDEITTSRTIIFDISVLKDATNNFSEENKLGEGGFGPVYKGILPDGQIIAVKRLSRSSTQGIVELRNEVELVAKLQHKNLVTLLGFCLGEQEKLLVYEYLSNGSLDRYLFGNRPSQTKRLDWHTRYKIIEGIGRGLRYLHEDSRIKIIHRDLKASNILLDDDMNPKISDFGLARLFSVNETQRFTCQLAGTYGYMSPEYIELKQFSTSSDVYSYGVLVLEIVTGRKNRDFVTSDNAASGLLGHVWNQWNEEKVGELVDHSVISSAGFQLQQVLRCVHIGLLCVQGDPTKRPDMASIALMLSTDLIAAPSPSAPGFSQPLMTFSSVNHDPITEMLPR